MCVWALRCVIPAAATHSCTMPGLACGYASPVTHNPAKQPGSDSSCDHQHASTRWIQGTSCVLVHASHQQPLLTPDNPAYSMRSSSRPRTMEPSEGSSNMLCWADACCHQAHCPCQTTVGCPSVHLCVSSTTTVRCYIHAHRMINSTKCLIKTGTTAVGVQCTTY